MAANKFSLLMQLGPSRGETRDVSGEEFVLGRDPSSNWVIEDVEVSRGHARLLAQTDNYAIEDLGSTNGTFVNGQRIRSILPLEPGATIRLGEKVLLFYDLTDEESTVEEAQNLATAGRSKIESPEQAIPQVEMLESVEQEQASLTPAKSQNPFPDSPVPVSRVEEITNTEMPFFRRPMVMAAAALVIVGLLAISAFLWYVDANFLWCDVFGSLIANCR